MFSDQRVQDVAGPMTWGSNIWRCFANFDDDDDDDDGDGDGDDDDAP